MKSLQDLYPGDYESLKNANVDIVLGTCEWLLQHRLALPSYIQMEAPCVWGEHMIQGPCALERA